MRNPFDKEKKEEIGVNLTPKMVYVRQHIDKIRPLDEGGAMPRKHKGDNYNPQGVRPRVNLVFQEGKREGEEVKPFIPKPHSQQTYPRHCIVKVDLRGYKGSTIGGSYGNKRLITTRLSPFNYGRGASGTGSTGGKVAYIGREEALEGQLFTCYGDKIRGWETTKDATDEFKTDPTMTIILSPEDPGADLVELTKRFMEEVYRPNSKEAPRLWVAGIHGNTNHKHVHILISCKGVHGGDAQLEKKFVFSGGLQKATGEILTQMQGPRTWAEEAAAEKRKNNRKKWLREDQVIYTTAKDHMHDAGNEVENRNELMFRMSNIEAGNKKLKASCSRRLYELKQWGLVKKGEKRGTWILTLETENYLRSGEFAEAFALSEKDLESMKIDTPFDNPYSGEIMETVESNNGKMMYFMISETKPNEGKIHLRKEAIMKDDDRYHYERAEGVNIIVKKNDDGKYALRMEILKDLRENGTKER